MYTPKPFAVRDPNALAALLAGLEFGSLVTHGEVGLVATHMPFLYDAERQTLAGHMAKANPQCRDGAAEALVIFQGPHAYVSPNWYPSKAEHGRAVPTWNYEAVHIHGRPVWHEDEAWLRPHLADLSDRFEAGQPRPWTLAEAAEDYVQMLLGHVVGLEIAIERIEAKRKLSQNHPEPDRLGVIAALSASGGAEDRAVAALMVENPPHRP